MNSISRQKPLAGTGLCARPALPYILRKRLQALLTTIAVLLVPVTAISQSQASGAGGSAAGTLGAVGVTGNGGPAGTPGTNPGVSSSTPDTAGTPTPAPGTTLKPVGTNVDGSQAGTSGATTGPPTLPVPLNNPLNRNPANRSVSVPDMAPAADDSNSSSRPTLGAVTTPDSRDRLVIPDPSRDSTTNPVANPPR